MANVKQSFVHNSIHVGSVKRLQAIPEITLTIRS